MNTFKDLLTLEDNWNDNGAKAFSKELIRKAQFFYCKLSKKPLIFPTAFESVQLEYEDDNGNYLEMEVYNDRIKIFEIYNDVSYPVKVFLSDKECLIYVEEKLKSYF